MNDESGELMEPMEEGLIIMQLRHIICKQYM